MQPTHGLMAITKRQLSYLKFCQPSYLNTVCFKQHQKGLLTKHLLSLGGTGGESVNSAGHLLTGVIIIDFRPFSPWSLQ